MGFIAHNAIIVTSWNEEVLAETHQRAVQGGLMPTEITPPCVNGYRSFLVPPDGSKEGWEASDAGDARREEFKASLASFRHEDASSPVEWVEVRYGNDDRSASICDTEWMASLLA